MQHVDNPTKPNVPFLPKYFVYNIYYLRAMTV